MNENDEAMIIVNAVHNTQTAMSVLSERVDQLTEVVLAMQELQQHMRKEQATQRKSIAQLRLLVAARSDG